MLFQSAKCILRCLNVGVSDFILSVYSQANTLGRITQTFNICQSSGKYKDFSCTRITCPVCISGSSFTNSLYASRLEVYSASVKSYQ